MFLETVSDMYRQYTFLFSFIMHQVRHMKE